MKELASISHCFSAELRAVRASTTFASSWSGNLLCKEEKLTRAVVRGSVRSLASSSFVYICMRWPHGPPSEHKFPVDLVQSMDPIRFHRWLERFVYDETGLDQKHVVQLWCGGCCLNSNVLPDDVAGRTIDVVIKEKDATTRLRAAIKHESARSKWLSRVVIKQKKDASGENNSEQLSKDRADIVPVSFDGVEAPRVPTYLKLAPQRNDEEALDRCAWLSLDRHPHIAPLLFHAGPNLFFLPFAASSSCNACEWLASNEELASVSAWDRQRVILAMSLQIATALEHMHCVGALHLDVKPDNVMVSLRDVGWKRCVLPLHTRVHCHLCDWELSSEVIGASGQQITKRGTPGFWSPEQVVDLPSGARRDRKSVV